MPKKKRGREAMRDKLIDMLLKLIVTLTWPLWGYRRNGVALGDMLIGCLLAYAFFSWRLECGP